MEASESKFSFYNPPVGRVNYVKEADLYGIYRYIVDPKYAKRQTDMYRALLHGSSLAPFGERVPLGGKGAAAFKAANFAYCLFSGTFGTNRKNDGLQQHSGLLCLDFDHLDTSSVPIGPNDISSLRADTAGQLTASRSVLLSDPYFETLLLFVSPSGNGLKWVIPIDLDKATHEQWYTGVSNYLRATYGLQADPACKNIARACFLPHDPDCYIAPRLHRELAPMVAENPCVLDLMNKLCATNIKIEQNEQQ